MLPADGVILDGQSSVDESLLTGEYLPHPRQAGDAVTGGTLNVEGPLTVEVGALGDDSRLSAIVRLLERAQADKPRLAEPVSYTHLLALGRRAGNHQDHHHGWPPRRHAGLG